MDIQKALQKLILPGAIVLFGISIFFAQANSGPGHESSLQLGLASCGFAIAGGLALVAGALVKKRDD